MKIDFENGWVHLENQILNPLYASIQKQKRIRGKSIDQFGKECIGMSLEKYFDQFRRQIIGTDQTFESPWHSKIVYADWTASGRMYRPIEEIFSNEIAPFVANTHTETNMTGSMMTLAYKKARNIIKGTCQCG